MAFIKGLNLCENFFFEAAQPILEKYYPMLQYTAGLIGYGSDVLGFDDNTSTDHMWGPRFYLFLKEGDYHLRDEIMKRFSEELPYTYQGYSVNFSNPNLNDHGVRCPELIDNGVVSPLIFIHTFEGYARKYLGKYPIESFDEFDWLSFSEHRLLGLTAGKLFVDMLGVEEERKKLRFYPETVKLYLIASQWALLAEEQAFVGRCGEIGDELGSRIITARIAERLMRLCFLYCGQYAPYSKWFGTGFAKLPVDEKIKTKLNSALGAATCGEREGHLVRAQQLAGALHNESGITDMVENRIQPYYGRNSKVIFADRFAGAVAETLKGTVFEGKPLIGSLAQVADVATILDEYPNKTNLEVFYENL